MESIKNPVTLLIVEDEEVTRRTLARLVGKLGFVTLTAGGLDEARTVLNRQTPDIMILDLMLGNEDGTDLLREARAAGKKMIIAIVTAVTNELRLHEVTALEPD